MGCLLPALAAVDEQFGATMAMHAADKAACRLAGAEEGKKIVSYTAACTVVAGPTAAAPKAGIAPVQTLSRSFSVEHGVELDPKQLEAGERRVGGHD